jgi:hypothetical protein
MRDLIYVPESPGEFRPRKPKDDITLLADFQEEHWTDIVGRHVKAIGGTTMQPDEFGSSPAAEFSLAIAIQTCAKENGHKRIAEMSIAYIKNKNVHALKRLTDIRMPLLREQRKLLMLEDKKAPANGHDVPVEDINDGEF